jgi:large subunit ribosomal protein L10
VRGGRTLNRDEKDAVIVELTERLKGSDTVLAAEFSGLSVKEVSELRDRLRSVDAGMTVVKNTLARRAVSEAGREGLLDHLIGPSALIWVNGDPAAAAKAISGFVKEHPEGAKVKGGLLGEIPLTGQEISRLGNLPSREVLLGQLAGGMIAPLSGLAGGMSNLISGLARSLSSVRDQRAAEAPAS